MPGFFTRQESTILPISYSSLWKLFTKSSTFCGVEELSFSSCSEEYLHMLFVFFCNKHLSLVPNYSFIQLFIFVSMVSCTYLGLQFILHYFVVQIVPALDIESSFRLVPMSLWHATNLLLFEHFLTFWYLKILQTHLAFSLNCPRNSYFSKEPIAFIGEQYLETRIWVCGVPVAIGVSSLLGPLRGQCYVTYILIA